MTGKGVAIQGGLAIAGLLVAYTTWQREPERATGEVVIIDSTKAELASVHYEDENGILDVSRRQEGGETSPWLHIEDKTPVPPPVKPGQPTPPPAAPKTVRGPRELRGEEPAEKFLTQFTPFRSPRAFGVLDPAARTADTRRGVAMIRPRSAISAAKCACCKGVTVIGPWPMPMLMVSPGNHT